MKQSPLNRALTMFDGKQTLLAKEIGCSQQYISYLINNESPMGAKYVLSAESATGIPRHEWRPDIYPAHEYPSRELTGRAA